MGLGLGLGLGLRLGLGFGIGVGYIQFMTVRVRTDFPGRTKQAEDNTHHATTDNVLYNTNTSYDNTNARYNRQ